MSARQPKSGSKAARARHRPGRRDGSETWEALKQRAGLSAADQKTIDVGNGPEAAISFPAGLLKILYALDTERLSRDNRHRETAIRIQRVVGAAMAAEAGCAQPRSLDDVMADVLRLPWLKAAVKAEIDRRERGAFNRALNEVLSAREAPGA